jgi:hypothetical protein
MYAPWLAWRPQHRLRPGAKVHEVAGPNLAGGFRMVATFTAPLALAAAPAVLCEQGDWISGWAWYLDGDELCWCMAGKFGVRDVRGRVVEGARVLVADGAIVDGCVEVTLSADGSTIGRDSLRVPIPLAWSPDGAFLTVGYGRPFPVCDAYEPPAPAPAALLDVTITTGTPPAFDFEAELTRVLRHQ